MVWTVSARQTVRVGSSTWVHLLVCKKMRLLNSVLARNCCSSAQATLVMRTTATSWSRSLAF